MDIVGAMLKIFLAMALGFFLYRIHILNDNSNSVMSKLVSLGTAPCMIFASIISMSADNRVYVYLLLAAGLGIYVIEAVIAFVSAKLIAPDKKSRGAFEAAITFSNSAFIAFPVGQALMGDIGVSYLAILNIHQNLFAYSLGVFQLTKGGGSDVKFSAKKLFNPPIISALLGLALFLLGIRLPDVVMEPIEFVGQITSPLSMVVVGSTIGAYSLKHIFNNPRYYFASAVKLLVMPAVMFALAFALWGASDITSVIAIHCAMPTATIVSLIAIMYNADYKTTTSITGLTDILCLGTIPLMWTVTRLFY